MVEISDFIFDNPIVLIIILVLIVIITVFFTLLIRFGIEGITGYLISILN